MDDAWEVARLTARELAGAYAAGTLTPVEVLEAAVAVVDDAEPELRAFWVRSDSAARAQAKASAGRWRRAEALGPLDGVPVTVKENLARAGVPMPAGSAGVVPRVPERDSPVVARLAEAGAVLLGSTVMPDWGMLSSGVSSLHGVTRSPWNPAWTTGGSSSGAGAACAAGYAPLHVGTDIGGSIRLPGTWLGLATLKPSAGRVPLDAPYLGRVAGPMTRTVADASLLMSVLARPDSRDWTALPPADLPWHAVVDAPIDARGLRVGLHVDAGCGMPVAADVARVTAAAGRLFADAGAVVEDVDPFVSEDLLRQLDMFWRVRSWNDYVTLPAERQAKVLPFVRRWVEGAAGLSASELMTCYAGIMEMQRRTVAASERFDVVVSPVAPVAAFPAEWPMPFGDVDGGMSHIAFTAPYNMSGQPAATVNAGFTDDGRPVGVQLSGRRFDDIGVLQAASWLEAARPAAAVPSWPIGPRRTHLVAPAATPPVAPAATPPVAAATTPLTPTAAPDRRGESAGSPAVS